ncbi:hypothetical protein FS749_000097 [Ceratobasidium sp. UAMH 11750]|nr:hypothetical protein FS749_000097 [Ceratobasidium sp. UAMH 11750]
MSNLPGFPTLPASVGGQPIPDFLSFEIVGDGKVPAPCPVKDVFDFSIKKSTVFGRDSGDKFDQGCEWHPLRAVRFDVSHANGLTGYQGYYADRSTDVVGKLSEDPAAELETFNKRPVSLKLDKDDYITGFRAYVDNDVIVGLRIWTTRHVRSIGKVSGPEERGQDPEAFFIPDGHKVINFFGHTNDQGRIHGVGVSYNRRLASLPSPPIGEGDPAPTLKPIYSQCFMDAATQTAWANNNMAAIEQKKKQASADVDPIYQNIEQNGDNAWTLVEKNGQSYYISWTRNALVWAYAVQQPSPADDGTSTLIVSIGTYSSAANFLTVCGYVWSYVPTALFSSAIGLGFARLVQPLLQQGVSWGLELAAEKLTQCLASVGLEELSALVAPSVVAEGGLIVAGVIGMLAFYVTLILFNWLFKQYCTVINVYNFDPNFEWSSITHYDDNAKLLNGSWEPETISKFGAASGSLLPPGFQPVRPVTGVVTYFTAIFTNVSLFLEGLGEGIVMARSDNQMGLALKYVVHRFSNNEIGLQAITSDPSSFDIGSYYNNSPWTDSQSVSVQSGNYIMTAYTPELGGAKFDTYTYDVNIGLPPAVTP